MPSTNQIVDTPKKPALKDWHKADIICGLWKLNTSIQKLSREHGYANGSLRLAIRMPWPKAEGIIARALGVTPQQIWPSRYHADGSPRSGRGERGLGDPRKGKRKSKPKDSTAAPAVNADLRVAA